jgi:hypothetical protein
LTNAVPVVLEKVALVRVALVRVAVDVSVVLPVFVVLLSV